MKVYKVTGEIAGHQVCDCPVCPRGYHLADPVKVLTLVRAKGPLSAINHVRKAACEENEWDTDLLFTEWTSGPEVTEYSRESIQENQSMSEDRSCESSAKSNLLQAGAAAKKEDGIINALQGIGYAILHLAEVIEKQSLPNPGPVRASERDYPSPNEYGKWIKCEEEKVIEETQPEPCEWCGGDHNPTTCPYHL